MYPKGLIIHKLMKNYNLNILPLELHSTMLYRLGI